MELLESAAGGGCRGTTAGRVGAAVNAVTTGDGVMVVVAVVVSLKQISSNTGALVMVTA